jgi:ketosteroid isomerase-like protein
MMNLRIYLSALLMLVASMATAAQSTAPDAAELTKLLNDFLAGASRSDAQIHDRFWAEDLIYTRSAGVRVDKAEVMRNVRSAPAPKPGDPKTIYTAEDIRIQQYGTTAIVAFRLVAATEGPDGTQVANLLNSGTFLKRDGKWQVVNWQSTRMPASAESAKTEVMRAHDGFFRALLNGDIAKLQNLTDDSFVMTHGSGNKESKKQLIDRLSAGQEKYSKLETSNALASVTGETAVVRGTAVIHGSMSPTEFTVAYTLVFTNQGGGWRAVALHGSSSK